MWNFLVIAKCHINISYYYYYYYIMCNTKIKCNQGLGNPGFSSKSSTNAQWRPHHAVPNWDMRMGQLSPVAQGTAEAVEREVVGVWDALWRLEHKGHDPGSGGTMRGCSTLRKKNPSNELSCLKGSCHCFIK